MKNLIYKISVKNMKLARMDMVKIMLNYFMLNVRMHIVMKYVNMKLTHIYVLERKKIILWVIIVTLLQQTVKKIQFIY